MLGEKFQTGPTSFDDDIWIAFKWLKVTVLKDGMAF